MATFDLDAELDHLYRAPLDDFVRLRNDLVLRLRADGRPADALRVHALGKPPLSAWAVNQLYWRARADYDALMTAGRALGDTQRASLEGRAGNVREADRARDRALASALQRALDLLASDGQPATPAMRVRIATNLEALAAYGGAAPGVAPGRLTADLDAPGFEVFRAIAIPAQAPPKPARRVQGRRPAKIVSFEEIAGARRAVADAERALAERRRAAHEAEAARDRATDAVKAAEADLVRARVALDEAQAALKEAERQVERRRRDVPRHEREAARAKAAAAEAAAALDEARAALEAARRRK